MAFPEKSVKSGGFCGASHSYWVRISVDKGGGCLVLTSAQAVLCYQHLEASAVPQWFLSRCLRSSGSGDRCSETIFKTYRSEWKRKRQNALRSGKDMSAVCVCVCVCVCAQSPCKTVPYVRNTAYIWFCSQASLVLSS